MKKVAVLLAVYNGKKWIDEQLESILNQENVNVDIYISIDESTDSSHEYIVSNYNKDNIYILPYGERYGSAGKNFYRLVRDVDFNEYDFISFSDQDDIWHTDKLATAISTIDSKCIDAYSSNVIAFWENGKSVIIDKAQPQLSYDYFFEAAGPGCTYVFNNSLAQAFKAFINNRSSDDLAELHDWLLYAFARANGYKWYIDPKPGMLYRQHESNQVGANNSLKMWVKRIQLIKSGWYRREVTKLIKLFCNSPDLGSLVTAPKSFKNNYKLSLLIDQIRRRQRDRVILYLSFLINIF
ncbi:glycosyltransferase [Pseudescherichia vulneris]|uniref:glycosyltransferase n=1 Tax=Pseudescherichia vulneris TaxID=566 RepID=UPI0028AA5A60|nr:glycosyltransferase [Pseudescherichia vulneris]